MPEETVKADAEAAEPKAQEPQAPEAEPSTKESDEKPKPSVEESVLELDSEDITQEEDGSFTFVVDKEDPKSTVYKGKTLGELLKNVKDGVKSKDTFIRELQTREVKLPDGRRSKSVKGDVDAPRVEWPDTEKIYTQVARENRIEPEMLSYTMEDWRAFADEKGIRDFEVSKLIDRVEKIKADADLRIAEANVQALNDLGLEQEHQAVIQLLAKSKVNVKDFDYDAVLNSVEENPKNFLKNGTRRQGAIIAAAAEEIQRIREKALERDLEQKINEDIASGKRHKVTIKTEGPSKKQFNAPTSTVPKDYDEATDWALKIWNEQQKTS